MAQILLLEDNPDMMNAIADFMEMRGHEVIRGENGIQGLRFLETATPDIILSDVSMPGMNGLTFIQKVREHGQTVPCIMLSGNGDDQQTSLEHGANDFLLKPFRHEQLAAVLKKYIDY